MKVRTICMATVIAMLTSGCASLGESFQLGGGIGAAAGTLANYSGQRMGGKTPTLGDIGLGAGIGLGVGLLTAYVVHKSVEDKRLLFQSDETEMHFGDLPPSPFIMPQQISKKRGH